MGQILYRSLVPSKKRRQRDFEINPVFDKYFYLRVLINLAENNFSEKLRKHGLFPLSTILNEKVISKILETDFERQITIFSHNFLQLV